MTMNFKITIKLVETCLYFKCKNKCALIRRTNEGKDFPPQYGEGAANMSRKCILDAVYWYGFLFFSIILSAPLWSAYEQGKFQKRQNVGKQTKTQQQYKTQSTKRLPVLWTANQSLNNRKITYEFLLNTCPRNRTFVSTWVGQLFPCAPLDFWSLPFKEKLTSLIASR